MSSLDTITLEELKEKYKHGANLTAIIDGMRPANVLNTSDMDVNTMTFVLDGQAYTAVEDPSDGYRSYLDRIEIDKPGSSFNKMFDCHVVPRWCEARVGRGGFAVLEWVDPTTDKPVFSIGTDYSDDYYPCVVCRFDPTAMSINSPESVKDIVPVTGAELFTKLAWLRSADEELSKQIDSLILRRNDLVDQINKTKKELRNMIN